MSRVTSAILVSIFTALVATVVAVGMIGVSGISFGDTDIFLNLLLFIPLFIFFTWLFSLILGGLSHWDPVFYYAVCGVIAIVALIMGLSGSFAASKEEYNNIATAIGIHGTFFFIFIPKIDSQTQDYIVTETTYYGGWEVDRRQYLDRRYISGSVVKLIIVALLGGLVGYFAYAGSNSGPGFLWLIFGIEILIAGLKVLQSLRSYR